MQTKLDHRADIAGREGSGRINNVAWLLNEENLKECFGQLKKRKAAGVDGVTWEEYESGLGENLRGLVERMMKFPEHRISDATFLRLVSRFLRNGYMEEGTVHDVEEGTPQGGIISPVVANVYLHYVLDLWVERVVKARSRGVVEMVRYADDLVICVQYKDEAESITWLNSVTLFKIERKELTGNTKQT